MLSKRPFSAPDYQIQELDGELLLFHPASQTILHTNQTAALVWELCNGQHTVAEMVQIFKAVYPTAAETIEDDVLNILNQFASQGMITWE
jgi:hypothetical protein